MVYSVIATTAPSDPETADLVEELRSTTIPEATAGEDIQAYVGGSTASNVDLAAEITSRLPLVIIVVLLLSIIVLTIAFRSLLVPLQAAVTNVLCVGAAFGILTAAFQWGWGIDILGIDTNSDSVPIASYVPLMMFAVLFGLSMDYQVFLLSAVAMRRQVGDDDKRAIAWGMEHSGPVITAAGLIMIGVFGSFILNGDPTVKQFGVGLAVGGGPRRLGGARARAGRAHPPGKWAWWMPGWLGKVVPTVDIEGEGLLRRRAAEGTFPGVTPPSTEGAVALLMARSPGWARAGLALAGPLIGIFAMGVDASAVNVALPGIQKDLDATTAGLQWVIAAYMASIAASVVAVSRFGDILGRRRIFVWGLLVFGVGVARLRAGPGHRGPGGRRASCRASAAAPSTRSRSP